MNRVHVQLVVAVTALSALALTGCEKAPDAMAEADAPEWISSTVPDAALGVSDVKKVAQEGDTVTIVGRIGGRREPFTEGAAVFILVDSGLPACSDIEGDNCRTPWDYCCETKESMTANSATIQVLGEDGAPLAVEMTNYFEPLDEVVVVGTVGPRPTDDVLIVNATSIGRSDG